MTDIPLLIDTGKGISVKYKNRFIYSKYSPISAAEKIIKSIEIKENTIYLIPSPIFGYGINKIYENLPTTSLVINIELDSNLLEISSNNININYIENGFDFLTVINKIDYIKFKKCVLLTLNGGYDLNKEKYDSLYKILLNQLHNFWKNRYTETQMGQLWIKNTLVNLNNLKGSKPLSELKTIKPLVIIGAGESTESVLDLLTVNRNSIFILCVDTALQILLDYNIKPDVVLALEAQYYNLPDFYGAKDREIDLIYDLSSYPSVPRNLKGQKYYTVTQFSKSKLLDKIKSANIVDEFIPPLGSVGITALYIGRKITTGPIFLAGLDFSYKLGKTHSRGTPYHKTTLTSMNKINSGDTFINCLKRPLLSKLNKSQVIENTDSILYEYSMYAKELLRGTNRVYDLTNIGMDLGVPLISKIEFKQLVTTTPTLKEIIYNNNSTPFEAVNMFKKEYQNIKEAIKTLQNYLHTESNIESCSIILQKINYLFDHYPDREDFENLDKLKIKRLLFTLLRFKKQISVNYN